MNFIIACLVMSCIIIGALIGRQRIHRHRRENAIRRLLNLLQIVGDPEHPYHDNIMRSIREHGLMTEQTDLHDPIIIYLIDKIVEQSKKCSME